MNILKKYNARRRHRLLERYYRADSFNEKARIAIALDRMDAENNGEPYKEPAAWITTENKHRVPLDENGIAMGGGGGTLKGMDFSDAKSTKKESKAENSTQKRNENAKPKTNSIVGRAHSTNSKELKQLLNDLPEGSEFTAYNPDTRDAEIRYTVAYDNLGEKYFDVYDFIELNGHSVYAGQIQKEAIFLKKEGLLIGDRPPETNKRERALERARAAAGKAVSALGEKFNNARKYTELEDYDDDYREQSGNIWKSLTRTAKKAFADYTNSGYKQVNDLLRTESDDEFSSLATEKRKAEIEDITEAIDQSELKEDTILYRGISTRAFKEMFKMDEDLSPDNFMNMIGKSGTENAFMSCGSAEDTGFVEKKVQLEIYAPTGTKGLYVEPFSECGEGAGYYWDGVSPQEDLSEELETILQRGTSVQVVDASYSGGKYRFKVAVTGQDTNSDTVFNQNANAQ